MQTKVQNSSYTSRLKTSFSNNYKTSFWVIVIAVIVVGPIIRYMENLVSFAFAFSSINDLIYIPSTFTGGGFNGMLAACFSIGTKQNSIKTAIWLFVVSAALEAIAFLYMDMHGLIVPIQYRADLGDGTLDIIFTTATGYCVPLVARKLNLVPGSKQVQ